MNFNMNRGVVVFTSILAGLLIGLPAGAYIYYAWVPAEAVLRDAPPRMLNYDDEGKTPQYRDFYAVRAADKYQRDVGSGMTTPLNGAYDVLGVTTGDATFDQALLMVQQANEVVLLENSTDGGDPGVFTKNDEFALSNLKTAMETAKLSGTVPTVDASQTAPAIARNNSRLVGFLLLVLWALFLGAVVYVVDRWVGPLLRPASRTEPAVIPVPTPTPSSPSVTVNTVNVGSPTPGMAGAAAALYTQGVRTVAGVSSEVPLATFAPTVYRHGDDHYEDDFAINGPMGELIGECGVSIADRIGVDTPARVSALALWVFDKNDFQSTTKVLMTDYAWEDEVIRNKLKVRGEGVKAVEGGVVEIITSTLRVEVQVADLQLNTDHNPPRGYFQNVALTFTVYHRQA